MCCLQYELDGSTETHDPAEPWTTACPSLPGQTVNTLIVPVEQSLRQRSASLTSVRQESFRTMDPDAKFATPRPAPAPVMESTARRLGSASTLLQKRPCTRSPSPAPSWKRFFTRRLGQRDADRSPTRGQTADSSEPVEGTSLLQDSPATRAALRPRREHAPGTCRPSLCGVSCPTALQLTSKPCPTSQRRYLFLTRSQRMSMMTTTSLRLPSLRTKSTRRLCLHLPSNVQHLPTPSQEQRPT